MNPTAAMPPTPEQQLAEMGIHSFTYNLIRSKKGISLYRVHTREQSLILKTFAQEADTREIANYLLLAELGIPSLPLLGYTKSAILLPDAEASAVYRLASAQDLEDPQVLRSVAQWYRALHAKGRAYAAQHESVLYDETDVITLERLRLTAQRTRTEDQPLWHVIEKNFAAIRARVDALPRTLTYNDFWWDNLIVDRNRQSAFMFDYNLLGKGTVYGDLRNVASALSKEAADVFLREYAPGDLQEEALADDFLSHLVTLVFACEHDRFPQWAEESLQKLISGDVLRSLLAWL